MLGQRLKELREKNQIVQRQVAARLEIDTAYVSKMEKGDKQISRKWLPVLADMFSADLEELTVLWISDKVEALVIEEPKGVEALQRVLSKLKPKPKSKP